MTELYLISGFLGAGKTTLLQKLLREGFAGQKVALVENDFGAVSLDAKLLKSGGYTVQELRAGCICCTLNGNFVSALVSLLRRVQPDVVLIEPSGVAKLSDVEALCLDHRLAALAVLKQKITVVDAANCASYCENFGAFFEDQVRCADTLVFSHSDAGTPQSESARRLAQKLNPRAACFSGSWDTFSAQDILLLALACGAALCLRQLLGAELNTTITVFLGIMLQAVPFLLIGVLLSSAIQLFLSQQFIERFFPENRISGTLFAILAGAALPVCDCASIPIFRSLLRKGIPVSTAVTFMLVTPVINPVVLFSTYVAFTGNWRVVACRAGLGIVCAVLVGLTFCRTPVSAAGSGLALSGVLCTCGSGGQAAEGWRGALLGYLRHTQTEFFTVGKYLTAGAFVSAIMQSLTKKLPLTGSDGLLLPLLTMMALAFLLSLCSSSDAVVGRSFSAQLPMGAVMAFLVFGPMMDIKNVIMLSGSLPKKFILRLAVTVFVIDAAVVYAAFRLGLGTVL